METAPNMPPRSQRVTLACEPPGWATSSCRTKPSAGMLSDEFKHWLPAGCFHQSVGFFLLKRLKYELRAPGMRRRDQKQTELPHSV